jgi:hypothetical protein
VYTVGTYLKIVVIFAQGLEILLVLVEILEYPSADVHLLVNGGILEQLEPEIAPPERYIALGTRAATWGKNICIC